MDIPVSRSMHAAYQSRVQKRQSNTLSTNKYENELTMSYFFSDLLSRKQSWSTPTFGRKLFNSWIWDEFYIFSYCFLWVHFHFTEASFGPVGHLCKVFLLRMPEIPKSMVTSCWKMPLPCSYKSSTNKSSLKISAWCFRSSFFPKHRWQFFGIFVSFHWCATRGVMVRGPLQGSGKRPASWCSGFFLSQHTEHTKRCKICPNLAEIHAWPPRSWE